MTLRLLALAPLALLACSPDVSDLSVTGRIEEPSLTLTKSAFGTAAEPQGTPEGSFYLSMSLGQNASGGSDVMPGSFALVNAANNQLITALPVQATAPKTFRIEIADTQRFLYKVSFDKPIPLAGICAASQVAISGTFHDGARNKNTDVRSEPFALPCPP